MTIQELRFACLRLAIANHQISMAPTTDVEPTVEAEAERYVAFCLGEGVTPEHPPHA